MHCCRLLEWRMRRTADNALLLLSAAAYVFRIQFCPQIGQASGDMFDPGSIEVRLKPQDELATGA
jgi:hypothetical protein